MKHHYTDLGNASDWLNQISHGARPIRSTTQIWVVTLHQYGISALASQTSFGGQTSGSVAKCGLFSQANWTIILQCFPLVWLTVPPRLANARCRSFSCWCFFWGENTANITLIKLSSVNVELSWVIMIREGPQTLYNPAPLPQSIVRPYRLQNSSVKMIVIINSIFSTKNHIPKLPFCLNYSYANFGFTWSSFSFLVYLYSLHY